MFPINNSKTSNNSGTTKFMIIYNINTITITANTNDIVLSNFLFLNIVFFHT